MLFAAELLCPSKDLWIVSPWISNVAVLDNRAGDFAGLEPSWARSWVRMEALLVRLLELGTRVQLITRPSTAGPNTFASDLRAAAQRSGVASRLSLAQSEDLHEKGIVSGSFYLAGSMNLTFNGVELLEEVVRLDDEAAIIAETLLALRGRWEPVLERAD
jgi:hypothetical protein